MTSVYHTPVLLEESVRLLDIDPAGTYVDLTFGGGGHSRRILSALGDRGRLYAFDQDRDTRSACWYRSRSGLPKHQVPYRSDSAIRTVKRRMRKMKSPSAGNGSTSYGSSPWITRHSTAGACFLT